MSDLMLDVGQANELKLAFRRAGYESAEVKTLCEGNILAQVREVLLGLAHIVPIQVSVVATLTQAGQKTITVLQNITTLERIAIGKHEWKNPEITNKRFPHDPMTVGEWEYDLYHPNRIISSDDAKSGAEVDGWLVAKAENLLALGQAFPEEQRKFPIIALGSVCEGDGSRRVLGLWSSASERSVNLYYWRGGWDPDYRFLRVRRVKA